MKYILVDEATGGDFSIAKNEDNSILTFNCEQDAMDYALQSMDDFPEINKIWVYNAVAVTGRKIVLERFETDD
jgi:hypothetical protein